MILLLGLVFLGLILWGGIRGFTRRSRGEGESVAVVIGAILLTVMSIICPIVALQNGMNLMQLEAFYTANTQNYEFAIDETASYLSQEEFTDVLIEGSLERLKQAGYVSERIAEWRDAVNEYNLTVASMQYFNRNIFTGVLFPDGIENMKLLIIK